MGGTLIYVVGPSGVGKDSILDGARQFFSSNDEVVFVKRCITRKAETNEAHYPLTFEQFTFMEASGAFLFHWASHGLKYGIPMMVTNELAAGKIVVVNGSREYLPQAQTIFPALKVVSITAPTNVLRARLMARGRETPADIDQRLARGKFSTDADVYLIDNSGDLRTAVDEFVNYVRQFDATKVNLKYNCKLSLCA